jgi:uncharacterized protein
MGFNLQRTFRYYALRFKRLGGDPRSLAMGTAIGILIGLTPTFPLHTVAIIGTTLLMRANTIAALISATMVSNPLTMAFQYYICWKIGNFILPDRLSWTRLQEVLAIITNEGFLVSLKTISNLSIDALMVMMIGGILLAIPPTVISYYFSLRFFIKIREKRRQKHLLN